ncbi:MAG: substrate-binding domain-containing protein [Planctomycetales bacterium]|nr:substrate-binding domain-containing protein [Planctomycetales bacterium]
MSKSNAFLLAVAAIAIVAAAWYRQQVFREPPQPTTLHVAFVTGGSGPYWQSSIRGAEAAAKEYHIEIDVETPASDESLEQQTSLLAQLKYSDLDGVAVSPLNAEEQTPLINRIQQETNLVTFDSDAPLSQRRGHVGTSNYGAGALCAQLVGEAIPDGGPVLVLLANLTKENLIDRKAGFEDALKRRGLENGDEPAPPEITVVDYFVDNGDDAACAAGISRTIGEHEDLACIVGMNARHGPIILSTLKELDRLGSIKAVTFDAEAPTLQGVEDGAIYATIAQDPYKYGYEAVRMLHSLAHDGASDVPIVGGGTINITAEAIRQSDVQGFRERLQSRAAPK